MDRSSTSGHSGLEIAIIGMVGRFPGARNVEQLWRNLRDGVESISWFSDEELAASGVPAAVYGDPRYVRGRPVLEAIEQFDAGFFGYSPREAQITDPQQRLFLECAWEALESAGYDPEAYRGLIGVYAGAGTSSYFINLYSNPEIIGALGPFQIDIANDKDYLTTRVSYKLNLQGPSVAVQTACSTSLVATHLACQGLLSGECDMALAGGVSAWATQKVGYLYQEGGIASPDGHCRAFDAAAKGTMGGNGVAIVVLKRLEDAIADGDQIHAVIKGSAINNDGGLKVGYTAPRVEGQAAVIRAAQIAAEVAPETISYVEAHGTGTELGDPIEVAALTRAFRAGTARRGFCALGSIKTNIGHLDAAAGAAGLIKAVLALKHQQIPPSLHFREANPKIDFAGSPFYVSRELQAWRRAGGPLRAGVSSFGIGGTNAHVVLEEAPEVAASGPSRAAQVLVVSARSQAALAQMRANLSARLASEPRLGLADVAYTLQVGRRGFRHRQAVVCENLDEAVRRLNGDERRGVYSGVSERGQRRVVFMFSGQGVQYVGMGRELYEEEAEYRRLVDECAERLVEELGFDLRQVLYAAEGERQEAERLLGQTRVTQPALFVVEYALARQLMAYGVKPAAMIGHSIGEYVAACVAGVFSLADGLRIVAARGRLMQEQGGGAMLAVELSGAAAQAELREGIWLAAENGERQSVLSGGVEEIERVEGELRRRGVRSVRLASGHAFHSGMMQGARAGLEGVLSAVELREPAVSYISNVTGEWVKGEEVTKASYWGRQMCETVRFGSGLAEVLKGEAGVVVEVGPGRTLSEMARQAQGGREEKWLVVETMAARREAKQGGQRLAMGLGQLWVEGVAVAWEKQYEGERRRRVELPTYAFERQRYWIERRGLVVADGGEGAKRSGRGERGARIEKKAAVAEWYYVPTWKRTLSAAATTSNRGSEPEEGGRWVVFADRQGLGREVSRRLREAGQAVAEVRQGVAYQRTGADEWEVNAEREADYERVVQEISGEGKLGSEVVYLWELDSAAATGDRGTGVERLVKLARALGREAKRGRLRVSLISEGLQEVSGEESLTPEKAQVVGLSRVIGQEQGRLRCRSIDVRVGGGGSAARAKVVEQLVGELLSHSSDLAVAYRGNYRSVQVYEPVKVKATSAAAAGLRQGGVYLITGGLGQIGLGLADYLARTVQARLVLTARTPLPPPPDWPAWLATHDEADPISRKLARLRRIEAQGGEVLTLAADVGDLAQMRAVMARIERDYGQLHGVVHAAGIIGRESLCAIQALDRAAYDKQARAKVAGVEVLGELLREQGADFCVLMSSLAAVLGGLGFGVYAAVNAYLDSYAQQENRGGRTRWVSVNWDGWRMGEAAAGEEGAGATTAELGMSEAEGMEVFAGVLGMRGVSQVVISTGELSERLRQWVEMEGMSGAAGQTSSNGGVGERRGGSSSGSEGQGARSELEERLVEMWEELLGVEGIGVEDNFFELGGHSLLVIQVMSRIRDEYGVEIAVGSIFEAPTIAELAIAIVQSQMAQVDSDEFAEMLAEIEQLSDEEAQSTVPVNILAEK